MSTRRLAAIMFADIVGYTAMMQRDEASGMAKAHRFSEVMEAQVQQHHGEVLEFRGDGSLCIFNSAVEAVKCAKAIQQRLKGDVPLRIGIHIGDIVLKNGHIYGDGVNLASRVESMGVPGSVLVTERVIHDVKSHPELEMTSLGKFQFKNVANPMEVFALANEGFAIPKATEMKGKGKKYRPIYKQLAYAVLGILLLVGGVHGFQQYQQASALKKLEKSLVVLPFSNKSEEADTDYFSDGITEDILIQLSKLKSLKVISQTSAMRYKGSNRPLNEIADELNVNFVLRGTVRKIGNQVRISAQLVQAEEDVNLWAENYDFELEDVFEVQTEVSRTIAKQLEAQISPEEEKGLEQKPTENQQAYQLYLRGRQLIKDRSSESFKNAEKLFNDALELDPSFVHVKAELANIMLLQGEYGFVANRAEYFTKAYDLSQEVLIINPHIERAYDILGFIAYKSIEVVYTHMQLKKSLKYFQNALEINPRDEQTLMHVALLMSTLGKDEGALLAIDKALEIDPFSPAIHSIFRLVLIQSRNFDQALKHSEFSRKLFPKNSTILRDIRMLYSYQVECNQLAHFVEKNPQLPNNDLALFICYCQQEDVQKAHKYFNKKFEEAAWNDLLLARLHGNIDGMFTTLMDKLPNTHPHFLIHPIFDILRDDPRYEAYLRQSAFGQVSDEDVEAVMELVE